MKTTILNHIPTMHPSGKCDGALPARARHYFLAAAMVAILILYPKPALAQGVEPGRLPESLQKQFQDYGVWRKGLVGQERERIDTLDELQQQFEKHVRVIYSVLPKASEHERVTLLHALGFINVLEAKAHDAYMMEQMAIWTVEKPESKGMNRMALFPLYRTGLQAANLLDDAIPAVASLNDGEEYQRWVTQLSSDLKSLRVAFWDRALEVQPDAGPMFQQLGIKKPAQ